MTSGHGVLSRRRSPSKGDRKERAILDTCERLLSERPLTDIGVDELAAGAGISRSSFYFYFESKAAVLRALVDGLAADMERRAEGWMRRAEEPPEAAIARSLGAAAQQWHDHGPVLRAAVQAWGTVPELAAVWDDTVRRYVDQSATQIAEERRAGAAKAGPDADALARALIWMTERCFYTTSLGAESALPEDELVPTLTKVWLRSIYADVTPPAAASPDRR